MVYQECEEGEWGSNMYLNRRKIKKFLHFICEILKSSSVGGFQNITAHVKRKVTLQSTSLATVGHHATHGHS